MPEAFLVIGSSRGLGREIVTVALAGGHRVTATVRDPRSLEDLVTAHGDQIRTAPLDVTDPTPPNASSVKPSTRSGVWTWW